jgi:hypothetical protein
MQKKLIEQIAALESAVADKAVHSAVAHKLRQKLQGMRDIIAGEWQEPGSAVVPPASLIPGSAGVPPALKV